MEEIKQSYKIDMFPMLSGKCDRIEISFMLQPEPVAELEIVFYEPFEVRGEVTNKSGYISFRLRFRLRLYARGVLKRFMDFSRFR